MLTIIFRLRQFLPPRASTLINLSCFKLQVKRMQACKMKKLVYINFLFLVLTLVWLHNVSFPNSSSLSELKRVNPIYTPGSWALLSAAGWMECFYLNEILVRALLKHEAELSLECWENPSQRRWELVWLHIRRALMATDSVTAEWNWLDRDGILCEKRRWWESLNRGNQPWRGLASQFSVVFIRMWSRRDSVWNQKLKSDRNK